MSNRQKGYVLQGHKADIGDVSKGSNPFIYTFCTLILNCLFPAGDT